MRSNENFRRRKGSGVENWSRGAYPLGAAAIVRGQHAKAFKVIAEHQLQLSSTIIWRSLFSREWRWFERHSTTLRRS
jgi:hypothetical protein